MLDLAHKLVAKHPEFDTVEIAAQVIERVLKITARWNTQIDAALDQHIKDGEPMTIDLAAEIMSYGLLHEVAMERHEKDQRKQLHVAGGDMFKEVWRRTVVS